MRTIPSDTNMPRDHPPHAFYTIEERADGMVDVTVYDVRIYRTEDGFDEFDCDGYALTVEPYPQLEDDIRFYFYDWLEGAKAYGSPLPA